MSAILSGVPSHHGFILSNTVFAFNKYAQRISTLRACQENGVMGIHFYSLKNLLGRSMRIYRKTKYPEGS